MIFISRLLPRFRLFVVPLIALVLQPLLCPRQRLEGHTCRLALRASKCNTFVLPLCVALCLHACSEPRAQETQRTALRLRAFRQPGFHECPLLAAVRLAGVPAIARGHAKHTHVIILELFDIRPENPSGHGNHRHSLATLGRITIATVSVMVVVIVSVTLGTAAVLRLGGCMEKQRLKTKSCLYVT